MVLFGNEPRKCYRCNIKCCNRLWGKIKFIKKPLFLKHLRTVEAQSIFNGSYKYDKKIIA